MSAYITLVDALLAIFALEWLALGMFHRRTGRGLKPAAIVPNLLAGASLLLAWRCNLAEAGWLWTCLCLVAALFAHVIDLAHRWLRDAFTLGATGWREPS